MRNVTAPIRRIKKTRCRSETAGASYIELIIVLPVLLLLMMGTIEMGRLLSHIPTFSTMDYEAVLTGAETNTDLGAGAMSEAFEHLWDVHQAGGTLRMAADPQFNQEASVYDLQDRTVISSSSAEVAPIFDYLPKDLHMRYEAPLLLKNPDMHSGDLKNFRDGRCTYDCSGTAYCNGGPPAPMNPCNGNYVPPPPPPVMPGCFTGDTPVSMADGSQKPIRDIRKGDLVMAYDIQTGAAVSARVVNRIKKVSEEHLVLNGTLRVTPRHRFFVSGKWVAAEDLKPGDRLLTILGKASPLLSASRRQQPKMVYNLTIERFQNYFAGGFLVHNAKIPADLFLQD